MEKEKLLYYLFPKGILEYFEVGRVEEKEGELYITLEEMNIVPKEAAGRQLESKGFYEGREVQDFPLRGRKVILKIKRRRWRDKETGEDIVRDWKLVAEGTKYTQEFADFLKELDRK